MSPDLLAGVAGYLTLVAGLYAVVPEPDPPEQDLMRFPSARTVVQWRELNAEHRQWVQLQQQLRPRDAYVWFRWEAELEEAREALHLAEMALWHRDQGQAECCRGYLRDLQERLGPADYQAGVLPVPIPFHQARIRWPNR